MAKKRKRKAKAQKKKKRAGRQKVKIETDQSEIVIAFVAPLGVDLGITEGFIERRLSEIGYSVEQVRVTRDVMPKLNPKAEAKFPSEFERLDAMMDIGNEARAKLGPDIIAKGVANCIAGRRPKHKLRLKTAYLINSVKHPDEVQRLRQIYPRGFYLIGVNAPAESRKSYLRNHKRLTEDQADTAMTRDRREDEAYGQQVNQTFHLADFFVAWSNDSERVENSISRFVDIIFGDIHRTPTFGEYAMFLAFSASLRSADLSRQVGAVLARDGEILSAGANDCPKAGGGLYWPQFNPVTKRFEDFLEGRDSTRGEDSNRRAQIDIINDIVEKCSKNLKKKEIKLVRKALAESRIKDLTEFGRVVHAEMEALLACARKGVTTVDATIYCTTFPCHNCAKHIIASGVRRVVFVEPYLKSQATSLYDEIITIGYPEHDGSHTDKTKVRFEPFFGVGPRRFFDLFSMNIGVGRPLERKDGVTGQALRWQPKDATPRVRMLRGSYLELESEAADEFEKSIKG